MNKYTLDKYTVIFNMKLEDYFVINNDTDIAVLTKDHECVVVIGVHEDKLCISRTPYWLSFYISEDYKLTIIENKEVSND